MVLDCYPKPKILTYPVKYNQIFGWLSNLIKKKLKDRFQNEMLRTFLQISDFLSIPTIQISKYFPYTRATRGDLCTEHKQSINMHCASVLYWQTPILSTPINCKLNGHSRFKPTLTNRTLRPGGDWMVCFTSMHSKLAGCLN